MEYSNYLSRKEIKLQLLEETICSKNIIVDCIKAEILNNMDILLLNRTQNDPVGRNCLFWMTIQNKGKCWENLIEIFRANRQDKVADLLEKAERNDNLETLYSMFAKKKPIDVKVEKSPHGDGEYSISACDHAYDYGLDPKNIGLMLIINITKFDDSTKSRFGAEKDAEYMRNLWEQMGYKVYSYEGRFSLVRVNAIVDDFLNIFRKRETPESCVVFIGSHGCEGKIEMSNGDQLDLYKDFIKKFSDEPVLFGKPKLFFVQACRFFPGKISHEADVDYKLEDTLVCFSTMAGKPSNRQTRMGSYFVYTLIETFMTQAYKMEIRELLDKAQQNLIDFQTEEGNRDTQICYYRPFNLKSLRFNLMYEFRNK